MRIGCNNVKIKYLLLQRLRNVVTQIFVATMNGICCNWQIFGRDLFIINNKIINQIYLKRNTDNHMINKNKNKFQVSIEEDRKTQPELARME